MRYKDLGQKVPQDRRQEVNTKILQLIDAQHTGLTKEEIYNLYTGDGGLHGLDFNDYSNFSTFTKAKQEVENGQFFTPHNLAKKMVDVLQVKEGDFVADITCGAGVFFNFFKPEYCFGTDVDIKSIKVAQYLYPEAKIENRDIRYYDPGMRVDVVIGNPPFNLRWDWKGKEFSSQFFYVQKAAEILKPGGILIFICPDSFLKDEFYHKSVIETIDEQLNFVCQYKVDKTAFKDAGVKSFATKVMIFQRASEHLVSKAFNNTYVTEQEAFDLMVEVNKVRTSIRAKVMLEIARDTSAEFDYKVKKYLFEIKTQPKIKKLYPKAVTYIQKFHTQKCPDNVEYAEWYKNSRITESMVISYLKRAIKKQSIVEKDEIRIVSYQYGYKLKGYSSKTRKIVSAIQNNHIKKYQLLNESSLPLNWKTFCNESEWKTICRGILKLNAKHLAQSIKFSDLSKFKKGTKYLNNFSFVSRGNVCKFIDVQKNDIIKIIQKDYAVLNWQQGSGKSSAALAYAQYNPLKNTFIVSAALAINLTWKPFLDANGIKYVMVKQESDIALIKKGDFVLLTMEYAIRHQSALKDFIKSLSQKVTLVFDESDEITNNTSQRTKAILNIFRKVKRKLLATGTTTRNNISELYSQLELLYNNSHNMICDCVTIYKEEYKEGKSEIKEVMNKYRGIPFPAYKGNLLFKRCFNPSKTTVFGIQKHNQSIYNEENLRDLLEKTVITKKFKDIAGDKYTINNILVTQKPWEKNIYKKIASEFDSIGRMFFKSTGNSRKDAMLRILRQIDLMIRAVSVPQTFGDFDKIPAKFQEIEKLIRSLNEKVAIGCTTIDGLKKYEAFIQECFPDRKIFNISGVVSFKGRENLLKEFEKSENGILVCTQMSLKSSLNIPYCSKVIIESLQWNIPKIEQFYFRFIRFDSIKHTDVYFINYENTIEMNLMALLMAKERLNDYIKTLDFKEQSEIFDEYGVDLDILNSLMTRDKDEDGKLQLKWGDGSLVS